MPKVKITGLPKYQFGPTDCTAELGPGYVFDEEIGQCVTQEEYNARRQGKSDVKMPDANFEYQEVPKVQWNNPLSGLPAKTGPGTGVNPSTQVEPQKCPKGFYRNEKGECVRKRAIEFINDAIQSGLALGSNLAADAQSRENRRNFEKQMRSSSWTTGVKPAGAMAFGKTQINEGVEFPNMLTPPNDGMFLGSTFGRSIGEFGGSFPSAVAKGPIKIKIVGEPDTQMMKYGGQSNYGFDSGWRKSFTEMNKISSDYYKQGMSEERGTDEEPVLEAEGGETIYKPDDQTLHSLHGPRHTEGGIKLTASQVNSKTGDTPSFIYSDTRALKIKDKDILNYFGVKYERGGVTPAKISKKFDLNEFEAILEDPNSDVLAKATAQLMIDKNERKLAELASVQENMKGLQPPKFAQEKLQYGNAKYGGFMPMYANGGGIPDKPGSRHGQTETKDGVTWRWDLYGKKWLTDTDFATKFKESGLFTPEQLEAFGKRKKTILSEKAGQGDVRIPKRQPATGERVYGDITLKDVENLKARHPWYFKDKPNWDPTNPNDVGDFQQQYNEKYAKKYGYTYFVPKGSKDDRGFNRLDGKFGEFTYNAPALEDEPNIVIPPGGKKPPEEQPKPKYACFPDGKGGFVTRQLPAGSAGGYDSEPEAAKHCGKTPNEIPYDYLLPDKMAMIAAASVPPVARFPMIPDLPYNKQPLALEDWRAKAAQRFSTQYAAPAAQLAVYGPTQGLAGNLSFLAGQTAQQMAGEDIAPTISRNIDRVNQFLQATGQRQDAVDLYNLQNKIKRWEGYNTALQQYDNAKRAYASGMSKAFDRAWKNRMHLGHINVVNPNFYVDPTSGQQVWKGNAFYTGVTDAANSDLGKMYGMFYNQNLETLKDYFPDETERKEAAKKLAWTQIKRAAGSDDDDDDGTSRSRGRRGLSGIDLG